MSKTCAFDEESFENDLAEIAIEMELYSESSDNDSGEIGQVEIGTAGNSCSGHTESDFSISEVESDGDDFAIINSGESDTENNEINHFARNKKRNHNDLMHAASKGRTPSQVETNTQNCDATDEGRTDIQSRETACAVKHKLVNISNQRAEQNMPAKPLSPRKRQLEAESSPVHKRGRVTGCLCNINIANTYLKGAALPILQNIKPSLLPLGPNSAQSAQAPWCPLSAPSDGPHSCPICSAQLRVRNVPVRHTGKSTVPAFFCSRSQGHVFMRCFNNEHHTDLCECKRNRQGKLVHRCALCPKNKQKSVLCDHCLARFGTYSGASSFRPKENCPYYLREHPHVIKHSCLRTLRSLVAAGTMRKLRHPMYATVRMEILLELGDRRGV